MNRNTAALRKYDESDLFSKTVPTKPGTVPASIGISVTVNWDASGFNVTGLTVLMPSGIWLKHGGDVTWTVSGLKPNQAVIVSGLDSGRPLNAKGKKDPKSTTLDLKTRVLFSPVPPQDPSLGDPDPASRVADYSIQTSGVTVDSYLAIDTSGPPINGSGREGGDNCKVPRHHR